MFPGATASVFYNEAGEVLGWDYPAYDEPAGFDPDYDDYGPYDESPWYDSTEECVEAGAHAQDGSGTGVSGVYTCDYCGGEFGEPDGEDD